MAKLLVGVLALSMLGYLGYWAMYKTKVEAVEDRVAHAPKRQLDNVRTKAAQIEEDDQRRADELEKKTTAE